MSISNNCYNDNRLKTINAIVNPLRNLETLLKKMSVAIDLVITVVIRKSKLFNHTHNV